MYAKIVLVALVICCLDMFPADALQPGRDGVCTVATSLQKTRRRTYYVQTKKMCGKKRCVVKRTKVEPFTITRNQTVCCKGWGYVSEDDSCSPLCSTGCIGGRCVKPDVCHCDPPAVLDTKHNNLCILPVCEDPCVNSLCVANNTCQCNTDYVQHNATHCYRCNPGYTIDADFNCVPICDQPCVNGHCIGPNICGCLSGYRLKDTFTCEPYCESCVNSVCTAPNVCTCLEGFIEVNGTCVPRCDSCAHGQCVGPNVCVCDDGYTKGTGGCVPTCNQTCVNGFCSAPNSCSCNEGYVSDDDFKCVKPCGRECEGGCDDEGKCLDCSVPFRFMQ